MGIHIMELAKTLNGADLWSAQHNQQRPLTLTEYETLYKKELPQALNYIRECMQGCTYLNEVKDNLNRTAGNSVRNYDDEFGEFLDVEIDCSNDGFEYVVITLTKEVQDNEPIKIADCFDLAIKGLFYEYECLPLDEKLNTIKMIDEV